MVSLIAVLALGAYPQSTVDAAYADYYAQRAAGHECRYLHATDDQIATAKFVAVLASREPLLDYTVPVPIGGGLLRLNLTALRWTPADWSKVCGAPANPYTVNHDTLIVHAGFFVDRISDQTRSDAYFRFLFGGDKIPKTLNEFLLASGGIDRKKQRGLEQLHVEGHSGVNVASNAARLVELLDGIGAYGFVTYDVRAVQPGADPLEQLDRNFKVDASEVFVLAPKVSTTGIRGVFPVTALANGQGQLQTEAPPDIVVDSTGVGGLMTIRNAMSCVSCHSSGPQPLNTNALRDRLARGVELLTYDERRKVEIETKHLATMDAALDRWRIEYAAALMAVNGLTPAANAAAFVAVINEYRFDVTVATAAADLFCTPAELRLSLGWSSANGILIDNRIAGLAHDIPVPRSAFEARYLQLADLLCRWREATR